MFISLRTEGKTFVYTSGCQMIRVEFFNSEGLPTGLIELNMEQAEAIAEHLRKNTIPSIHSRTGRELK